MSILKVIYLGPLFFSYFLSLGKIGIFLKYLLDKNPKKQPLCSEIRNGTLHFFDFLLQSENYLIFPMILVNNNYYPTCAHVGPEVVATMKPKVFRLFTRLD